MSPDILAIGELLVEIMRPAPDQPLGARGIFAGPFPSGAPLIFAGAAAAQGARVGCIGCVGDDDFGRMLLAQCDSMGIDRTHLAILATHATGVAFVAYASSGQRAFIFHVDHAAAGQIATVQVDPEYVARVRLLHITGSTLTLSAPLRTAALVALSQARPQSAWVSFDPNLRPEALGAQSLAHVIGEVLTAATIVLPSASEVCLLTGIADPVAGCRALIAAGTPLVVLKQGALGCIAFAHPQRAAAAGIVDADTATGPDGLIVAPHAVAEVDPTGAGDCFAGVLVADLLAGHPLPLALRRANCAAALSVTRLGPMEGIPSRAAVDAALAVGTDHQ